MTTRAASDDAIRAAGRDLARHQQPMSRGNARSMIAAFTVAIVQLEEQSGTEETDAA
jgi:hypothetical protein